MKFTLEGAGRANLIRSYSAAGIDVGGRLVPNSCIVSADTLITEWAPQSYAEFAAAHLAPVLALEPELVILGTGARQQFAAPEVRALLAGRAVGLEAMELGAACRTFNVLLQEERRVAAALFVR